MSITVESLIGKLPPYKDEWELIHPNQTVKDIMAEVLEAHYQFAPYYDEIALCFDDANTGKICDNIYQFLKNNISYHEENEKDQTTALPTGILIRQKGDCKHYAGFTAGILDALNRTGRKINWCYVFASYKMLDKTPHHVFVEVDYNGEKFWIDPTPGSDVKDPAWFVRKKIKADMALRRNIAGTQDDQYYYYDTDEQIGKRPFWQLMPAEGVRGKDGNHGTNPYFSGPFLALQHYKEDPYSVEGTDWNKTADAINAAIAKGPEPGHTVNGQFVKWIYDHSMKGWNFYYPMGVQENYVPDLPSWYPHLIINGDDKLVFDKIYKVDDYMNDEIHAITAWAQSLINDHSATPYPITPRQVKEYSQGKRGNDDDLFTEDRGQGFLKEAFNFGEKIGLFGIRNAYLGLVGLNAFGMATKLKHAIYNDDGSINADAYTRIMDRWHHWGGNDQKFLNTIDHGAGKKALLGIGNTIGIAPAVAIPAWVAIASALIAAITPLVESILKGKKEATNIDYTIDPTTGKPFPAVPITPGTGTASNILDTIKKNPLPVVALGLGAFLMLNKPKKVTGISDDIIPLVLLGGAVWYFLIKPKTPAGLPTVDQMKQELLALKDKGADWITYITNLTGQDLINIYNQYFPVRNMLPGNPSNGTNSSMGAMDPFVDYSADGRYRRTHTPLDNGNISVFIEDLITGQNSTVVVYAQ